MFEEAGPALYTDEFAESAAASAARTTLVDTGGTDVLNAAAVTSASVLNLTPGYTSAIDGRTLVIAQSSVIEIAYGGDGNDVINGNSANNELYGMRGDDSINGSAGDDLLVGGEGDDRIDGGEGNADRNGPVWQAEGVDRRAL